MKIMRFTAPPLTYSGTDVAFITDFDKKLHNDHDFFLYNVVHIFLNIAL